MSTRGGDVATIHESSREVSINTDSDAGDSKEENISDIYYKPSLDVSEISMKSAVVDQDDRVGTNASSSGIPTGRPGLLLDLSNSSGLRPPEFLGWRLSAPCTSCSMEGGVQKESESKYVPKREIPINAKRLREFGNNLATVIPYSEERPSFRRFAIHNMRGYPHSVRIPPPYSSEANTSLAPLVPFASTRASHDHTVTTAPLTEYNLHEIEMIESMFRDQDRIKPHFEDKPDPVPIHFCMRPHLMRFLWKIVRKCCSWISCIVYFR